MSEENVEIARRLYPGTFDLVATVADPERFEATRIAFEPLVHRDFETVTVAGQVPLTGAAQIPEGSSRPVAHGMDGFASAWLDWLSAWERWLVTANLLTLRDRRIARLELFFDRAGALEAAGLRE